MLNQSFSAQGLLYLLTRRDPKRYSLPAKWEKKEKLFAKISKEISTSSYEFPRLKVVRTKSPQVYAVDDLTAAFAIRKLNDNLRRLYHIKQADRGSIILQVIALLKDAVPMNVLRLDIKSFYESIPKDKVLQKIFDDPRPSPRTKQLLRSLYSSSSFEPEGGFPRGISTSATLSEYYMRDFDCEVRNLKGVYYYARFVDDIIVFSEGDGYSIKARIEELLNTEGLELNPDKSFPPFVVDCRCRKSCSCSSSSCACEENCFCHKKEKIFHEVEYLGYSLRFPDVNKINSKQGRREVMVGLSNVKIRKYKMRITKALLDFVKTGDYQLLTDRVRFLTGNHILRGRENDSFLKSGIYYSYPAVNTYEGHVTLDRYLRSAIYAKKGSFGNKLSLRFTRDQRRELAKNSFKFGAKNRVLRRFSEKRLHEITRCWE